MVFEIGDRIPYVIISKDKSAIQSEKSEDPQIAFDQHLPLDYEYYLQKQIFPPIERIFSSIMDVKEIFTGEHTRVIKGQKISKTVGIGAFFKEVKKSCVGCKKSLDDKSVKPLCMDCQKKEKQIYLEKCLSVKSSERVYQRLWSECQRCE